jgi:peptidoglycan/xylan/chitin deacetylase (PgdA/CDA1 family)
MNFSRRRFLDFLFNLAENIGLFSFLRYLNRNKLTVLNYHRVDNPNDPGFVTFKPNVSSTMVQFSKQMDYVKKHYSVITSAQLVRWLYGNYKLPSNPLLITFDDGYLDNLTNAYPVLAERELPAVIFLATEYMGSDKPLYWDYLSYLFIHTEKKSLEMPGFGEFSLLEYHDREIALQEIIDILKSIPETEKADYLREISEKLEVSIPFGAFSNLHLNWDQIRKMRNLIEFGSHTASHPIMTRIDHSVVQKEIHDSLRKIEQEINEAPIIFAYPNGHETDYSPEIIEMLKDAGVKAAFTLLPGLNRLKDVREKPYEIRRVFLLHTDSFPRFIAKISGLDRWIN